MKKFNLHSKFLSMRKIVISLHTSLDGFVAGPNGEMDWIKLDEEIFDLVGKFTNEADTALYGRVTYEMMEGYWPGAADQPNATKHDIEHSAWYNSVQKVVISKSMKGQNIDKTTIISDNIAEEIQRLKNAGDKNIMIFGSPSAAHTLMEHDLIDEYWLFVNPVLLGEGIPAFSKIRNRIGLELANVVSFACGVTGLNYKVKR
jgi:dihydrofolate reductase